MATIRPFSCYRKVKRAYTRKSKYKVHNFIKAVPVCKLSKFNFGDNKRTFPHKVFLVSTDQIQVRSYPHHVLRENKMITGAGADRMQTGMQRSFGAAVGLAAQLKEGTPIFCVYVEKSGIDHARMALKSAIHKLPGHCAIEVQ